MPRRRIRDPIHDLILFPADLEGDTLWALLQTAPVQRLRRIKQLGFSEFVYPGASHKRLSHSLGAMQMARRMLESFEKRDAIDQSAEHSLWRLATMAAALLHDIGHGPYSHVFEELSESRGSEIGHEQYTLAMIEDEEIASILDNAGILEKTTSFFKKEKSSSAYGTIISSQLDCDRLDFLCRDRYFCGLRSSVIDLEWLFDSLAVEKVFVDEIGDISEYAIVVNGKGLRVIEEFVHSYIKMYKDVYFHKTTRSMQHLATLSINTAIEQVPAELLKSDRFFDALLSMGETGLPLDRYLGIDDASFTNAIGCLANLDKGESSELANRFLNRQPLKSLDVSTLPPAKIKALRDNLQEKEIWHHIDVLQDKGYKPYAVADKRYVENIILNIDGNHVRLHQASKSLETSGSYIVRVYFKDDASRESATAILKSLA
jgi:uncharacterized protein